tara:strand:+ start:1398 stop:2000 length:603 start_codon:yes stop_codon:yes gene_type:complete
MHLDLVVIQSPWEYLNRLSQQRKKALGELASISQTCSAPVITVGNKSDTRYSPAYAALEEIFRVCDYQQCTQMTPILDEIEPKDDQNGLLTILVTGGLLGVNNPFDHQEDVDALGIDPEDVVNKGDRDSKKDYALPSFHIAGRLKMLEIYCKSKQLSSHIIVDPRSAVQDIIRYDPDSLYQMMDEVETSNKVLQRIPREF